MARHTCTVKYKYAGTPGGKPNTSTQRTMTISGNTESLVLAELRKVHKDREIIIMEIKWKD